MNATPKSIPSPVALTRDQLLEALDKDIATIASNQSAAGWNYWAILGAVAALLWLTVGAWEQGRFELSNVMILTLTVTVTWDWLIRLVGQLDSSPLVEIAMVNRFWSLTGLLGSTRTNILFDLIKKGFFLTAVLRLESPFLIWLRFYFGFEVFSCLMALAISYWDNLPEISSEHKYLPHWCMRAIFIFVVVLPASVGVTAWGIVWLKADHITASDWRMALVASAILYLMSLGIQNRVPTTYLNTYRSIRRNLAYNHISLEEARNQADIISIGGTLDQTLAPYLKRGLRATERAEMAFHLARQKVVALSESVAEWASQPDSPETKEKQWKSVKAQDELFQELEDAFKLFAKADTAWKSFEKRFQQLAPISREPINSVTSLLAQLTEKAESIQASYDQTLALLQLVHDVIGIWKDEKARGEKLIELRERRKKLENIQV